MKKVPDKTRISGVFIICLLLISACVNKTKQDAIQVLTEYEAQNPELGKLYRINKDKNLEQAISFIIAGIPNKYTLDKSEYKGDNKEYGLNKIEDITIVNSDSLLKSISHSIAIWKNVPWNKFYSEAQFYEYVLPYRLGHESLEYYWKYDAYNKHHIPMEDSVLVIDFAIMTNRLSGYKVNLLSTDAHDRAYSVNSSLMNGKCHDWAAYSVMMMRSLGIPSALELILYWGNTNNKHSIPVLVQPDDSSVHFNDPREYGFNFVHTVPKIYRRMYSIQDETPVYKHRLEEGIPEFFADHDLKDVTGKQGIWVTNVNVKLNQNIDIQNRIVYLAVFSPQGWQPVAYAERKKETALFTDVGTGFRKNGEFISAGDNIGPGILYLPCFYENRKTVSAAYPIINSQHGIRELKPEKAKQTLVLSRKYPLRLGIIKHAETMKNGVFEASSDAEFTSSLILHTVYDTPLSRMQHIDIEDNRTYRYIRFHKAKGVFSLAEFKVYDKQGRLVEGTPISAPAISDEPDLKNIYDSDPLTFFSIQGIFNAWAGLKFDKPTQIGRIEFCPRNDDNGVIPGNLYELFYWDGEWESLGQQRAEDYQIVYDNVPSGTIYWLRNLTRGQEERPFTYENNKQIWW